MQQKPMARTANEVKKKKSELPTMKNSILKAKPTSLNISHMLRYTLYAKLVQAL